MASAIFQSVICPQCGEREAIVFIRRSGDEAEGRDLALCESCAAARGIMAGKGNLDINIEDLIGAALDEPQGRGRAASASCPLCGTELGEIRRSGKLGCPGCADSFGAELFSGKRRAAPPAARIEAPIPAAVDYPEGFPLSADSIFARGGPEDDVVLWSSAWSYRNYDGLAFPGSPRGIASPSRERSIPAFLEAGAFDRPWRIIRLASLPTAAIRSLAERGILSRLYSTDETAPILSEPSTGSYALLDEGDHLRIRSLRPGLDVEAALASAIAQAESLGAKLPFARRPELGWICSRLSDCGLGASASMLIHIPGLAATGMRDRLFRSLLAEGLVIRGFYSSEEDSAAALYEIAADGGGEEPLRSAEELALRLSAAAAKILGAERRAREEYRKRATCELLDAEGRAYGIVRHCGRIGEGEAAILLSSLRLASLRGSLSGVDELRLRSRMLALGPGSIAMAAGAAIGAADIDAERARVLRSELGTAEYLGVEHFGTDNVGEGGRACSRD
jgi:Arginine kinase